MSNFLTFPKVLKYVLRNIVQMLLFSVPVIFGIKSKFEFKMLQQQNPFDLNITMLFFQLL